MILGPFTISATTTVPSARSRFHDPTIISRPSPSVLLCAPRVFLAGWHAQQDLPQFLSAADAIVLTSEREQFEQVLIEAMACGVPAVATRSLGPTAIIEDRRTGWLVQPDDEAALAAALADVVNDLHERERRGQAARLAVRERFSWATIAAKLAGVLEEVVRDRPAGNDPGSEYAPSHEHHADSSRD